MLSQPSNGRRPSLVLALTSEQQNLLKKIEARTPLSYSIIHQAFFPLFPGELPEGQA